MLQSEIRPPKWEIKEIGYRDAAGIYDNKIFDVNFTILDHKTDSIAYLFKEKDSVKIDLSNADFQPGSWIRTLKEAYKENRPHQQITVGTVAYEAKDLFHLLTIKEGDSLGVIMDHKADQANHSKIKSLFSNCNTVFIEIFYKLEDKAFADANYHSCSVESAKIMKACKVKHPIPVHFSRKYNREEVAILLEEFQQIISA